MVTRKTVGMAIRRFLHGPEPAAPNWEEQLQKRIVEAMAAAYPANEALFPGSVKLPEKYGHNLPERAVELLLMRLSYKPGARLLDVGHANIMLCQRELIRMLPEPRHLTGIDIAAPAEGLDALYETSLLGDVATFDFKGARFDLIWCISAMEHFGMDNSGYTDEFTKNTELDAIALDRLIDVLAPGGALLVTVPYGRAEDHGWFRQYDAARWQKLIGRSTARAKVHEFYFRHTYGAGWRQVPAEELTYTGYYDQANSGAAGLAAALFVRNKNTGAGR